MTFDATDARRAMEVVLQEYWSYLEKVWGVQVGVQVIKKEVSVGCTSAHIKVDCLYDIHRSELNDFPGITTPLMSYKDYPYASQVYMALMHWEDKLIEHLAH